MQGAQRFIVCFLSIVLSGFFPVAAEFHSLSALTHTASSIQSGQGQRAVAGMAFDAVSMETQTFLNQYGTSEIRIRTDQQFSFKDSSGDFLFSLYSNDRNVFFSQLGMRHDDERLTTNIGLGYRYLYKNWLLGYNAFYDTTWNDQNARWGTGIEAWRDYLKFSGNLYRGISGWHDSRQHQDYLERPANGWDIRAEG